MDMPVQTMNKWVRLSEAMASKNLTQNDLAALCGVTQGAVSHWLNCDRVPQKGQMKELSRVLGIPYELVVEDAARIFLQINII